MVRGQAQRRWLVVGVIVAVLVALPSVLAAMPAKAADLSLTALAKRIAGSGSQPYQGYAVATGTAALPTLPQLADVTALFNGETSLRIWYDSSTRWRIDMVDGVGERDVYQSLDEQTIWDYGQNQFTTIVGDVAARLPRGSDLAPPALGRRLLDAADPHGTALRALPAKRFGAAIGGIVAAGIRLVPSNPDTTVGRIDIWADPRTGLPLEVDITARGASAPVLMSRMLDISLSRPSVDSTEVPVPPPTVGNNVTTNPDAFNALSNLGLGALPATLAGRTRNSDGFGPRTGLGTFGAGYDEIAAATIPGRNGYDAFRSAQSAGVLQDYGGGQAVLVSTSLLNIVIVHSNRGRTTYLVAGLVRSDVLIDAAEQLATYRQ